MSITNVQSWAVDLSTVGPIYPMVGSEGILTILGFVLWIAWHVWQFRFEQRSYEEDLKLLDGAGKLENVMRTGKL